MYSPRNFLQSIYKNISHNIERYMYERNIQTELVKQMCSDGSESGERVRYVEYTFFSRVRTSRKGKETAREDRGGGSNVVDRQIEEKNADGGIVNSCEQLGVKYRGGYVLAYVIRALSRPSLARTC